MASKQPARKSISTAAVSEDERTKLVKVVSNVDDSGTVAEFTTDPKAPSFVPRETVTFGLTWMKKPNKVGMKYDLGKVGFFKGIFENMKSMSELVNPEIHVLWNSYCPGETYQNNMTVSLEFTQCSDPSLRLLYQHNHSMDIPAHHIFRPRQTVSVGPGTILPWAIGFDIDDFEASPDFNIGKLQVFLKGYIAGGMNYTAGRESELILNAPLDKITHTGTRLSRPRMFEDDWKIGGYKIGSLKNMDSYKLKFLQEEGVDMEALMLLRKIPAVLKAMKNVDRQSLSRPDVKGSILNLVYGIVRSA
jgi:hypothetical protein